MCIDAAAGGNARWTRYGGMRWSMSPTGIYSTGFYYGLPGQYTESSRYIREWQICAMVLDCDAVTAWPP